MGLNDFNNNINLEEIEKLKETFSNSAEAWSRASASISELNRIQSEKEARQMNALEQTAKNTGETKEKLDDIITNQNDYIKILKQQLKVQEDQLSIISNIFMSSENVEQYEKELLNLLKEEINDKHPVGDFIKNVGENVLANGTTSAMPILYNVFKKFLLSKGVLLP